MNKKKVITIVAAVLIVILVGIAIFIGINNANEKNKNNSKKAIVIEGVIKDEKFGGLEFTNTTLIKDGKQYTLSTNVKNPTDKSIDIEKVNIVMKDKSGNEITTLLGYIGEPMKPNETRIITASVATDLSKVKSKTIEASK